jgi:hypothetical protein
MKSFPNLISYPHEVFRNFSQFLAIFIRGDLFKFEIRLTRGARLSVAASRRAEP